MLRMGLAALAPVVLSTLFYLLDTKTAFGKIPKLKRQIIIGVVFGILACLATQFGIPYDGYVMNVRSAAPLTAGLVFGGPAGIIAGVMGALYRWFGVYWGVPTYTRVACSVATLLAGLISTAASRHMFNEKKTSWFYGMFIAIATEVFHMLLVFLTHMDDVQKAFTVVSHTAIPMIAANAVSVLLSLLFISFVSKERTPKEKSKRPITHTFSMALFIAVTISFLATSTFTYFLQTNLSESETKNILQKNVDDIKADILAATDKDLLALTEYVAQVIENNWTHLRPENTALSSDDKHAYLIGYLHSLNISEINIVDEHGVIYLSSNPKNDGFDFYGVKGGQAEAFLCLLVGADSYVQEYGPIDRDSSVYRKYAAVKFSEGGFIQVGYDVKHFQSAVKTALSDIANNRHIGQEGFVFIISPTEETVISAPADTVRGETVGDFLTYVQDLPDNTVQEYQVVGYDVYCFMKKEVEGHIIIACMPKEEVNFSRNITVYIGAFMQMTIFFILFFIIFFLLKNIVVINIRRINRSLGKITNGDLSTKVEIYANEEFTTLSNEINTTVDTLVQMKKEAEERIDLELSYAKSIQHSVLPSEFPPFPDRKEFEIYAGMYTAKEVGGDFYDFYFVDEDHLVFLIADVSGKGIPAAMFMMTSKTMIKSLLESGMEVDKALYTANEKLCASNEAGMFVTAWVGKINLKTGLVQFVNAGHNPPLVKKKDGQFEYLRTKPNLVLACMEGAPYRLQETTLLPGDEIFLYTDGVTEATNTEKQLLGEDLLLEVLNRSTIETSEETLSVVKTAIDEFVGEAPQFDDITMLSLKIK